MQNDKTQSDLFQEDERESNEYMKGFFYAGILVFILNIVVLVTDIVIQIPVISYEPYIFILVFLFFTIGTYKDIGKTESFKVSYKDLRYFKSDEMINAHVKMSFITGLYVSEIFILFDLGLKFFTKLEKPFFILGGFTLGIPLILAFIYSFIKEDRIALKDDGIKGEGNNGNKFKEKFVISAKASIRLTLIFALINAFRKDLLFMPTGIWWIDFIFDTGVNYIILVIMYLIFNELKSQYHNRVNNKMDNNNGK